MIDEIERPAVEEAAEPLPLDKARADLASEWQAANPQTPAEIEAFYRTARHYRADLDAWHQTPERTSYTEMLVHVARESGAQNVVDIGCGAGHDLKAIRAALPDVVVCGVEPNDALRDDLFEYFSDRRTNPPSTHWLVATDADAAPIETADLLVCIDVLEHLPDPEAFLGGIAQRAPINCLLFETAPTHDTSTPLHLASNRGWHPGRVLERHGWRLVDKGADHVRVWRRLEETGRQTASLLLCSYRDVATRTMQSIMHVVQRPDAGWRIQIKNGDADIGRSRAIIVTKWFHETNDDVFLMIDSDITFTPNDADHVIELCRNGYDIVCGAYPVHNGQHLSLRCLEGQDSVQFGPNEPPMEVLYAATGFMAVHRRVIEKLVTTVPLCHSNESWAFYPLFQQPVIPDEHVGGYSRLSEDWGFCQAARDNGFRVWMDPTVKLGHQSTFDVTVNNMGLVFEASQRA